MSLRNYSNTATQASLTASVTSADTSIVLASFAGFPAAPFAAVIDRGTASEEVVLVTTVSGSTVTATRGYDGTTAKSHAAGATFLHVTVAKDYTEANVHVNATTGAHGITGLPVGTTDTQTLTNKTLTAPVLTAASSTGTHSHANATFSGTVSVTGATTLGSVSAASASVSGALGVSGVSTLASLTVTGTATLAALSATTGSFSGTVTVPALTASGVVTAPSFVATAAATTATQLIRKGEADALGTTAATASTIARRDAAGRLAVVDGAAAGDVATKGQLDAAVAGAVQSFYDTGGGGGAIGTSAAAPTDTASVTIPAGSWDVWYRQHYVLSISSGRQFTMHLYGDAAEVTQSGFSINDVGGVSSREHTSFARITVGAPTVLTVRVSATGTGGTQSAGVNAILARKAV